MSKEIKQTWIFKQSPKAVWDYLTQSDLIEQWLTKTDFQAKTGHSFGWKKQSGKSTECVVLEVVPAKKLSYSWKVLEPDGKVSVDSVVTWILLERNGGTELQLTHTGFKSQDDLTAHKEGWSLCLKQIEELLNSKQ